MSNLERVSFIIPLVFSAVGSWISPTSVRIIDLQKLVISKLNIRKATVAFTVT